MTVRYALRPLASPKWPALYGIARQRLLHALHQNAFRRACRPWEGKLHIFRPAEYGF